MKKIFEQGSLNLYSQVNLAESQESILEHSKYGKSRTTVFISHKHDDLKDLKGILGFLRHMYGVKVYIDSQDPTMPNKILVETALNKKTNYVM